MTTVRNIALALVIIGAINWGLIGVFQFDLVAAIFGGQHAVLSRLIYTLVGISGLYCISLLFEPVIADRLNRDNAIQENDLKYGTEFSKDTDFTTMRNRDKDR